MKDNIKNGRLELRVSAAEKKKLERCAEHCGVSVSAYVRGCCMDKAPKLKPPDEFWQMLNRLYDLHEKLPAETQAEIERLILSLQKEV